MATTGSLYNWSRSTRQILKRNRKSPASFYLHLHSAWFRFEDAKGRLLLEEPIPDDGGSIAGPSRGGKTMTPGRELLKCIRDQTLPNYALDVLDLRRIPFFDGCLIVEIKDHRPPVLPAAPASAVTSRIERRRAEEAELNPASLAARIEGGRYGKGTASLTAKAGQGDVPSSDTADGRAGATATSHGPETFRVVLRPNEATLWTDLRNMNEKLSGGTWSEEDALEIEANILTLTSAPLCLTPDPHATRIANIMAASTAPVSAYAPLQSLPHHRTLPPIEPPAALETEAEEEAGKEKSSEEQRETLERRQREAIMRIMQGGWKSTKDKQSGGRPVQANGNASAAPFLPNFHRLGFIERYRANTGRASGDEPAANTSEPAQAEADTADTKKEGTKTNGAAANGTAKKSSSKKRKKQDTEPVADEEEEKAKEEEVTVAPKSKKKKTTKAASPPAEKEESETPTKAKKSVKSVPEADKKTKSKSKSKKAGAAKENEAETAPTPATDAPTPSVNGDAEAVAAPQPTKGAKKTVASKKTPAGNVKGKKSQTGAAAATAAAARRQSGTPSVHQAANPQPSPSRHGAASPFVPGTAATTPSPAISQQGIMGAPPFGNLPLGVGLPLSGNAHDPSQQHQNLQLPQQQQQQQQQLAAMAAYYGGLQQQAGMGANGRPASGPALNLPFGQAPMQNGGMPTFPNQQLNNMVRPPVMNFQQPQGANSQLTQLVQHLHQNPNLIHSLPPAMQAQLLHQLNGSGAGAGRPQQQQGGTGGNRVPSGWPPGQ